jgi:predicted dehydrogenase
MSIIKCAIVGCGGIAGDYDIPESNLIRTHAKSFVKNTNCNLVGVCDIDVGKARRFSEIWGPFFYSTDVRKLLNECKPDILSICTPTESHFTVFKEACLMGVPKIWLEKPAASSIEELKKMINLAEKYNVDVWVNYFRRYDDGFQKVNNRLLGLGNIQYVHAFYTKGFRHNGSHLIDLINWFFGRIKKVDILETILDKDFPSVSGVFHSKNTKINFTALDYKCFELFEMDIIGSNGRIIIKDGGQEIVFQEIKGSKFYNGYRNLNTYEIHNSSYGFSMKNSLEEGMNSESTSGLLQELEVQKVFKDIHKDLI